MGKLGLSETKGCCPGQTPHHLIPGSWVKHCSNYEHNSAPTVCTEGGSTSGSHGQMHTSLNKTVYLEKGKNTESLSGIDEAINRAMLSHMENFPHCYKESNIDCIKAQLDAFYSGMKDCKPEAKKIGKDSKQDAPQSDND